MCVFMCDWGKKKKCITCISLSYTGFPYIISCVVSEYSQYNQKCLVKNVIDLKKKENATKSIFKSSMVFMFLWDSVNLIQSLLNFFGSFNSCISLGWLIIGPILSTAWQVFCYKYKLIQNSTKAFIKCRWIYDVACARAGWSCIRYNMTEIAPIISTSS